MKLSEWRARFSAQYKQYVDELGEMGEETARMMFAEAPAEYGNNAVEVRREYDGGVDFRLIASGEDAMFLEFGTGVQTTVSRPTVRSDIPIEPGSWSKEHNGPFHRQGYWYYNGERLTGTPPTGAMQEACNAMQQWSSTIARRVFG